MSWINKLSNALNPSRLDEELADEMHDHVERRTADLQREGLSPAEARRRASVVFGSAVSIREASREFRLWTALETTIQDIRYAWRDMLRSPVFAITAVISLSLAIGANTAVYSLIDAVLLRPLPVPQPDRLFALETSETVGGDIFSYPLYARLGAAAGDSARIALFDSANRVEAQVAGTGGEYEEVVQQMISPDAFSVLGVSPALGRLFSPAEDHFPAPRPVVVLSHDYWRRRFGADPAIAGQNLVVSGRTYSILGVAAAGFSGAEPGKFVDVWLPIGLTDPAIFTNPDFRAFHLLGRLAPDETRERLAARLQSAFHNHQLTRLAGGAALPVAMQDQLRHMTLLANPGAGGISVFRRDFSRPLWILFGIAASILLIACANVASLLLARSTARSAEMALRVSLGARRVRLVRQLLTESLLIAALAGMGGWILARAGAPALVAMLSKHSSPIRLDLTPDYRVLMFGVAICALSALSFGVLPAWRVAGTRPMFDLRHAGRRDSGARAGRIFVGVQVAFAFCLVAGGTGFLFSLRNLAAVNTGFDAKGVTVLAVADNASQRDVQMALMQQLLVRAASLTGVQGAATAWTTVFSGARRAQRVILPGQRPLERAETFYRVSPGYLATLRTPLLSGRDFTLADNDNEPVPAIVNRAFARRYFGTDSVLGREFQRDDGARELIVGIAADSLYSDLRYGSEPIVYMPMKPPRAFTIYIRSTLDAASLVKMVDREAKALGSGMRVRDSITLEALAGSTISRERMLAAVGGVFAALGLVLAAVGLFGLLNYSVVRRTKEIGIRTALGARRSTIYVAVFRESLATMGVGMAVGLAGSLALMRFSRSLLFGVQPVDPMVIGTAMAVFVAVALIASGLPARRAAAVDPLVALRHE